MMKETIFIKLTSYELLKAVDRLMATYMARIAQATPPLTSDEMDNLTCQIGIWRTQKAAVLGTDIWKDMLGQFLGWLAMAFQDQPRRPQETYLAAIKRHFEHFMRGRPVFEENVRYLLFDAEEQAVDSGITPDDKLYLKYSTDVRLEDYSILSKVMKIMGIWMDQLRALQVEAVFSGPLMPYEQEIPGKASENFSLLTF